MHDLKHFVENINLYIENFQKRSSVDVSFDSISKLNEQRKELYKKVKKIERLLKYYLSKLDL